jgi:hypothetical protein
MNNIVQGWILFAESGCFQPLILPKTYLHSIPYGEGAKREKKVFICCHDASVEV